MGLPEQADRSIGPGAYGALLKVDLPADHGIDLGSATVNQAEEPRPLGDGHLPDGVVVP
jgi:hypothetical protein